MPNYDNCSFEELKKLTHFKINKVLIFQHDIKIQRLHLKNGTVPKQLAPSLWPYPFRKTELFLAKFGDKVYNT